MRVQANNGASVVFEYEDYRVEKININGKDYFFIEKARERGVVMTAKSLPHAKQLVFAFAQRPEILNGETPKGE